MMRAFMLDGFDGTWPTEVLVGLAAYGLFALALIAYGTWKATR